jgi:hypothetical protein
LENVEKQFPYFYKTNSERINLLYYQVYGERFKRDPTLMIEKDIDIYKSRQDQIDIIEKRRTLKKLLNKLERNKKYEEDKEEDSDTHSYKRYKAKEDFNSVLNKEVKKTQQQKPIKRKSERDETFEFTDDEDEDTEEVFRQIRECGPKKFYRNTDDDSEEEESEQSVVRITPPPTVEEDESEASVILITPPLPVEDIIDITVTPTPCPPSSPFPTPPSVHAPAYVSFHGHYSISNINKIT